MTGPELAITRSVMYASLFDYPLMLDQLHYSLVESDLTPAQILRVYRDSDDLQAIVEYRDGFFFPVGHSDLVAERRHREARSHAFLRRYRKVLRLICAVPFTRMVALSGSVAHLNLERGGDLDLCIVTRGPHAWTVAVSVLLLTKLLGRRRVVCANFVVSDEQLALDQQDLFTANQVIHLNPLIGPEVMHDFLAANPFVRRMYPNALPWRRNRVVDWPRSRVLDALKRTLEAALVVPAPLVEATCRRLYRWHLRRRSHSWTSPEQVRLNDEALKLHTCSHREAVLRRYEIAVEAAWRQAARRHARAAVR
jgi:hypothetical protein